MLYLIIVIRQINFYITSNVRDDSPKPKARIRDRQSRLVQRRVLNKPFNPNLPYHLVPVFRSRSIVVIQHV